MGDRANIVVKEFGGGNVWLYGHWIGARTIEVAASVIARGERLNDDAYLARIVFEAMIEDDDKGGTTSYGISTRMGDNQYPVIVLDPVHRTAFLADDDLTPAHAPLPMHEFAVLARRAGQDFENLQLLLGISAR